MEWEQEHFPDLETLQGTKDTVLRALDRGGCALPSVVAHSNALFPPPGR